MDVDRVAVSWVESMQILLAVEMRFITDCEL